MFNNSKQDYLIDISNSANPADMLIEISNIAEKEYLNGKTILLNLGNISLIPAHIFGIKSILESTGAKIGKIYTSSQQTQIVAIDTGFTVSDPSSILENTYDKAVEDEETSENLIIEQKNDLFKTEEITQKNIEQENILIKEEEKKVETVINKQEKKEIKTLYLKQTLRSGQSINYDGNIVIIGDCHPGSEIIAEGDINVWGVLAGIAHAGCNGNQNVSIRALKINAIQLRIADILARKPDRLTVDKKEKQISFTPEEAKISNGKIIIYS